MWCLLLPFPSVWIQHLIIAALIVFVSFHRFYNNECKSIELSQSYIDCSAFLSLCSIACWFFHVNVYCIGKTLIKFKLALEEVHTGNGYYYVANLFVVTRINIYKTNGNDIYSMVCVYSSSYASYYAYYRRVPVSSLSLPFMQKRPKVIIVIVKQLLQLQSLDINSITRSENK